MAESQIPYRDAIPARGHVALAAAATTAAAYANAILYKGVYFNAAVDVDIVSAKQEKVTVKGVKGLVYPVQNYGFVTGGGTTASTGDVLFLYD